MDNYLRFVFGDDVDDDTLASSILTMILTDVDCLLYFSGCSLSFYKSYTSKLI